MKSMGHSRFFLSLFACIRDPFRGLTHNKRLAFNHQLTSAALDLNSNGSGDERYHIGLAEFEGIYGFKMEKLKI